MSEKIDSVLELHAFIAEWFKNPVSDGLFLSNLERSNIDLKPKPMPKFLTYKSFHFRYKLSWEEKSGIKQHEHRNLDRNISSCRSSPSTW
jgi:hypothetical protein